MTEEKIPKILAAMHLYYHEKTPPYTNKDFFEYSIYCSIKRALNYKSVVNFGNGVVIVRNDTDRFEFSMRELEDWNFSFEEAAHD